MDAIRQLFGHYRYAAIALVTLLTLGIVGAVVVTTTSVGCGPANKLGLKTASCLEGGKVGNVAGIPSPSPIAKGGYTAPPQQPSAPPPPDTSGASANPPYNPGASSYPPYNPGSSSGNPYQYPASSGAPPVPSTGSGGPPQQAFSCRLPVYAGGPGSGGFIVFPGQTFVADPRSAVTVPSPSPGGASPAPQPQYGPGYPQGWYGMTYDAGYGKWLPVPYAWVSPDGVHYAYALGGDVYAQNVKDGTQVELASGKNFGVIDVENDGVYAEPINAPGLWFLPYSGTERQVTTTHFWQGVSHGAAYGTPTSQVPSGASNTIDKLDLKSGAITEFFTQAGAVSQVTGFDLAGHPIIQVNYQQGTAIFLVTSPSTSTVLASGTYGYGYSMPGGTPIADGHGIWYSMGNGVVLYSNGQWFFMASIGGQLAGQCL